MVLTNRKVRDLDLDGSSKEVVSTRALVNEG